MNKTIYIWPVVLLANCFSYGQDSTKADRLTVYSGNVYFLVKTPPNWIGNIENAADYYSNIVFYKNKNEVSKGSALIQVLAYKKQDEETNKDLDYDVSKYKKNYENLSQKDFSVTHKAYKCYSTLVFVEDSFYQYMVYINPGKKHTHGLSVAMNISRRVANEEELNAFFSIIASLRMMT